MMKKKWFCTDIKKNIFILSAFMLYIAIFLYSNLPVGMLISTLALIPVIAAAWLCGWRMGVLTGILTIASSVILLFSVRDHFNNEGYFVLGSSVIIIMGVIVGLLSDSQKRIQAELKERHQAEHDLAQTEAWYRSIFDGVNDAVFVETVDGKVLDVNVRACEMFGWTRSEFLDKTVNDMVPPEYQALLADNETPDPEMEFETVNIRANGDYFPVSVSGRLHEIGEEKRLLIVVRDLSDKKEIENELKKQHQFLSHVIESLSHPFYVVNVADYSIAIANSAARGGHALDQTSTCYALTHHLDAPCSGNEHICPLRQVVETRQSVRVEHIHFTNEGAPRNVEIYGYPIFDSRGNIVQMIESAVDITERKKEAARVEMLGHAVEQSQDGMAIANLEGTIVFANQAWGEMHGYTLDELLDTPMDLFHTEEQLKNEVEPFNAEVLKIGAAKSEIGHRRKDGSTFPTWMSVATLKDKTGNVTGLVASAHDITDRKRTEENLQKLYRATSQSPASIVITNLDGIIEYVNPAFSQITGYTAEEAIGQNPRILQSGVHNKEFYDMLWQTIQEEKVWRGEFRNKNKAGEIFWESASIAPIHDSHGRLTHYVAVKENITEKKRILDEMEEAKNAAEAAAKAKADFLANMSHEIRTPLNAIYGMTSLMLNTPLNEEQQDFIETIRSGGETLLHVINDILDFSKIEAGKLELEMHSFSLRNCVEDTLDLLAEKAAEKMIELVYYIEEGVPRHIVGDITRLRQILVNLLNNALKFTDKGEVVLNISGFLVENDQYELHFSVRDTGIGIPADKMDRLFKSFSQIDTSTTRKYGGTGLGLAISNDLAKNMGGSMWVESELGVGSTFHFTIIVDVDTETEELSFEQNDFPKLTDRRILIVDDNATNRLILIRQTESWGMKPTAVNSAIDALSLLEQGEKFDIGIFDMQMPTMDGFSLSKAIAQRGEEFPKIILTSIKRDTARESDARIAAFLSKPIKTSNLFNALLNVLDTSSQRAKGPKTLEKLDVRMAEAHPLSILLVEDNRINQKVALKLLGGLGYQADLAGNGIEALNALKESSYDVVFMDIQMPVMDGDEATARIRSDWEAEAQPYIIAMTAHALEGDREKYIARGMNDYISKPISVDALITALRKAKTK